MIKEYEVKLTFEEMQHIDGKVSEKAQKVIDTAKRENTIGFSLPVMNEIIRKAEEKGKLTWTFKQIRSCSYCDKKYDYHTYPRSGRYHNKGDKNHNKPHYYSGIAFNEGFITMQGYGDMCSECAEKYNVIHQLIDYILDNDLKIEIQRNDYRDSKYLKDDVRLCYSCEYEMAESEMGKSQTAMGDGYYPSKCPKCGAESRFLGQSHKVTNKFKHRLNPANAYEVQKIKEIIKEHNLIAEDKKKINISTGRKNENMFYVQEKQFTNGHRLVIKFDIKDKIYYIGHFWKDDIAPFIEVLNGYQETDREYFDW